MLFDCGHDWFQVLWLLWLGKMWILGGHLPVEGVADFFINFKKNSDWFCDKAKYGVYDDIYWWRVLQQRVFKIKAFYIFL